MQQWQIEVIRDEDSRDGVLYRLKGNSGYFREKYGTPNPPFIIRGEDTEIWEGGWKKHDGPACTIYGWRNGVELLPTEGKVYYGYVICVGPGEDSSPMQLGECIHESELEPIGWDELALASSSNITFENSDPELNKGIEVRTMNMSRLEEQVCGFCGKPGDEEKPLKVWISTYNETRWFYHDSCLFDEMERDELEE